MSRASNLNPTLMALLCIGASACNQGFEWLVVETQVSELCVVDISTEFAAVAVDGVASHVLGQEDLGITLSEKFSTEIFLRGVGISSFDGVENFDFIESLRVEVSANGTEPIELLNYISSEDKGLHWYVGSDSSVDLAAYIEAEDLELKIEFRGDLPEGAWTANLEVCVDAQAAYRESL